MAVNAFSDSPRMSNCLSPDNVACGAAKLILISSNTPTIRKSEIEYYAMLSKTGVHHYTGSRALLVLDRETAARNPCFAACR